MQFLRGHPYVENELGEVQESIESSMRAASSSTFTDLFTKPYLLKPLVISLVLMIGQQMCGVNAVIFFSVQVYVMAIHTNILLRYVLSVTSS